MSARGAWAPISGRAERPVGISERRLERSRPAVGAPRRLGAHGPRRGALAARPARGVRRLERARRRELLERHASSSSSGSTRWRRERSSTSWATRPWWAARARAPRSRRGSVACCATAAARRCRVSFISYHANLLPTEPIAGDEQAPSRAAEARGALPRPGAAPHRGERVGGPGGPVQPRLDRRLPGPARGGRGRRRGAVVLARPERRGQLHERHARGPARHRAGGRAAPGGPTAPTARERRRACRASPTAGPWRRWRACEPGIAEVVLGRLDRAAPGTAPIEVELQLRGLRRALPGARSALVTVERLPNSGDRRSRARSRCRAGA